jgi:cell division protease FtsH
LWVVIAVVLMSVFNSFGPKVAPSAQMSYSQFLQEAKQGRIAQVMIDGRAIQGRTGGGERFTTYSPETDNSAMIGELLKHGVEIEGQPPEKQGFDADLHLLVPDVVVDRHLGVLSAADARGRCRPWGDVVR